MCFIEKETQNFILKFTEVFLWTKTVLRAHGMASDEKPFFSQIYLIFWGKDETCCEWQVFFLITDSHFK